MRKLMTTMENGFEVGLNSKIELSQKELQALRSIVMLAKVKCERQTAEPELLHRKDQIETLAKKLHTFGLKKIDITF